MSSSNTRDLWAFYVSAVLGVIVCEMYALAWGAVGFFNALLLVGALFSSTDTVTRYPREWGVDDLRPQHVVQKDLAVAQIIFMAGLAVLLTVMSFLVCFLARLDIPFCLQYGWYLHYPLQRGLFGIFEFVFWSGGLTVVAILLMDMAPVLRATKTWVTGRVGI